MADLYFIEHALVRMQERGVSIDEVYEVVEDADAIFDRDDGRTEYIRMLDDGREVTVTVEDDEVTVVSVTVRKVRRPRRR